MLAIQKTYRKNASDFCLGKQELQTSLDVSSKNFANNGLYWYQFWNLWCVFTKHNSLFLSKFLTFLNTSTSLFVCYIICMIQISALATCISCCDDVVWFFKFFSTFLVSVVVGIVYKDLHDVLITDQPFRTITGATRWGYPPTVS